MDAAPTLRSINHNLVPLLRTLLREQNVTRAAEIMGLTQPAVSAALARLREALGDPLLVKSGRGLQLSPRGAVLLPQVEDLCLRLEQLWMRPDFQPATSGRSFTLTSPDYVQVVLAPALLAALAAEAPGMSLRFLDASVDDVTHHRIGDVDFIVSIRQSLEPVVGDFAVEPLYTDSTVAVVGPKHRLYRAGPVAKADYAADNFIVFIGGARFLEKRYDELRAAFAAPGKAMAVSQHYNSLMLIAAQSDCVALVPRTLAEVAARLTAIHILDAEQSDFAIEVCLAWDRRHDDDPGHRWLRDRIRAAAAGLKRR